MLCLSTLTITSRFTHLMDSLFHSTLVYSEPEVYSKPITVCGNGYIQRLYYNYFYKLSSFWQYQLFTLSTLKNKFYELFECRFHSNRFHSNILFSKGLIHRISHVLRLDLSPRLIFSTVQTVCVCVCVCWGGGGGGREGRLMGCVQSWELSACAPRLPSFILLGSFSDTLFVVSILDMIVICSRFYSPEGVKTVTIWV